MIGGGRERLMGIERKFSDDGFVIICYWLVAYMNIEIARGGSKKVVVARFSSMTAASADKRGQQQKNLDKEESLAHYWISWGLHLKQRLKVLVANTSQLVGGSPTVLQNKWELFTDFLQLFPDKDIKNNSPVFFTRKSPFQWQVKNTVKLSR